jgi:DNA-binding transcriptional MerR regulator
MSENTQNAHNRLTCCIIVISLILPCNRSRETLIKMLTPRQVSETLTVPTSTLRRWSKRFSKHLTPHEPNTHRSYTTSDLETLRKIRDLLEDGQTYDQIEPKLDIIEPDKSTALITLADFNQVLETTRATLQSLRDQLETQNERIDQLEKWIHQPLYKRIFTKPPNQKD